MFVKSWVWKPCVVGPNWGWRIQKNWSQTSYARKYRAVVLFFSNSFQLPEKLLWVSVMPVWNRAKTTVQKLVSEFLRRKSFGHKCRETRGNMTWAKLWTFWSISGFFSTLLERFYLFFHHFRRVFEIVVTFSSVFNVIASSEPFFSRAIPFFRIFRSIFLFSKFQKISFPSENHVTKLFFVVEEHCPQRNPLYCSQRILRAPGRADSFDN